MKKSIKFWIARDESITDDDHNVISEGKLHIFYDTPEVIIDCENNIKYFGNARIISEIPNYMFSNIKEGECIEVKGDALRFIDFKYVN